jgi:hypothetical protein
VTANVNADAAHNYPWEAYSTVKIAAVTANKFIELTPAYQAEMIEMEARMTALRKIQNDTAL